MRSNTLMHTAAQSLSGCIVSLKALPHVQFGWKDAFSSDVLVPLPGKKTAPCSSPVGWCDEYVCMYVVYTHTHTHIHLSIVPIVVSVVPAIIISGGKVKGVCVVRHISHNKSLAVRKE